MPVKVPWGMVSASFCTTHASNSAHNSLPRSFWAQNIFPHLDQPVSHLPPNCRRALRRDFLRWCFFLHSIQNSWQKSFLIHSSQLFQPAFTLYIPLLLILSCSLQTLSPIFDLHFISDQHNVPIFTECLHFHTFLLPSTNSSHICLTDLCYCPESMMASWKIFTLKRQICPC